MVVPEGALVIRSVAAVAVAVVVLVVPPATPGDERGAVATVKALLAVTVKALFAVVVVVVVVAVEAGGFVASLSSLPCPEASRGVVEEEEDVVASVLPLRIASIEAKMPREGGGRGESEPTAVC